QGRGAENGDAERHVRSRDNGLVCGLAGNLWSTREAKSENGVSGRAIETVVRAFHKRGFRMPAGVESIQFDEGRQRPIGRHPENRSIARRGAGGWSGGGRVSIGCAIEIAVAPLNQPR